MTRIFDNLKNISNSSFLVLLAIIGGFIVRIYGIGKYEFGDDEFWHLVVAKQDSLIDVIKVNFAQEVHPPLSYLMWFLMLKISDNYWWLRMSVIIPSLFLIQAIYQFSKLYFSRIVGCFLALAFAFGALPIAMSVSIRAYVMMMLALTWAAIFLLKYLNCADLAKSKRLLFSYFICCLIALQLNHSSAFVILVFGFALLANAFFKKNKIEFVVISFLHFLLMCSLLLYFYVLFYHFGFEPLDGYFVIDHFGIYLVGYFYLFLGFFSATDFSQIISLSIIFVLFGLQILAVIYLFKNKKYFLLNLAFVPFFLLVFVDYFDYYPFSNTLRNNLFLFFSIVIICAAGLQYCVDNFSLKLNVVQNSKLPKLLISLLIILLVIGVIAKNSFHHYVPYCREFSITKNDREILNQQMSQANISGNIFIAPIRNSWYFKYYYSNKDYFSEVGDNILKFDNGKIEIYFTNKTAIVSNNLVSLNNYETFFQDLFKYLTKHNKLTNVSQITFFDIGLKHEYFDSFFHPQFIKSKKINGDFSEKRSCEIQLKHDVNQEAYEFFWKFHSSQEVTNKFFRIDNNYKCGRRILLFSMTPKFIKQEILNKDFIDARYHKYHKCGFRK